ncbi:uncharacterized protein LOC133633422 [Entelurus aequoreus]|uniref:uncharacterized protein LOC133633422 n=1 Tax=Entelurus aequoreus TaxID=161455 RepID=UPI002B1E05D7|nr:uncharacterized protein LOC133633422 [Entelurus aequoreus]
MDRESRAQIFEWQVLPFGTTCSPCCAVYALQQHVRDYEPPDSLLMQVVEHSFYVDNCLHSLSKVEEAKALIDTLRELLSEGGFEIRQLASNMPEVVAHLPPDARSATSELWLSKASDNLHEPTLGLCWDCLNDTLSFKRHTTESSAATLRNVYSVLAKLYDPLGFIVPFTTRCKVLIQDMWKSNLGWDDQIQPADLLDKWSTWEMIQEHRWNKGPHFLYLPENEWPNLPTSDLEPDATELRKSAFVGTISCASSTQLTDFSKFSTWKQLLQETASSLHGAADAGASSPPSAVDFLQERNKWRNDGKTLLAGQVVLIVDPQLPRGLWPVGRITQTHPGADGRVRTARIQVKNRTYLRPVARLIMLPPLDDEDTTS